jgi:hypothetical protein
MMTVLGYCSIQCHKNRQTFQRCLLAPSSICSFYVSNVLIFLQLCKRFMVLRYTVNCHVMSCPCHVDFVYSQAFRALQFIRCITYHLSSLDSLLVLYNALIRSKLEYASVV